MADITRCTEPGCPACGRVITFDDSSSHEHLASAEPAPTCWSSENPLRYDYPPHRLTPRSNPTPAPHWPTHPRGSPDQADRHSPEDTAETYPSSINK